MIKKSFKAILFRIGGYDKFILKLGEDFDGSEELGFYEAFINEMLYS
jgi:hypothetical protein